MLKCIVSTTAQEASGGTLNMFRHLPGVKKAAGYEIEQSVLVESPDAWFLRTMGGALNKFTYSTWLKTLGTAGGNNMIMHWQTLQSDSIAVEVKFVNNRFLVKFHPGDTSTSIGSGGDPSEWLHFVLTWDPVGAGSAVYINGTIVAFDQPLYTASNWGMSSGSKLALGGFYDGAGGAIKSYMAESCLVAGQALGPESFAVEDDDGNYSPAAYEGDYGPKGFYLPFKAGEIGIDQSVNDNDFSVSGITDNGIVADSPSNNWCTLNPLDITSSTYSQGNLDTSGNATVTFADADGKWYYEKDGVGVSVDGTVGTVGAGTYNFGQRTFAGTIPAGYKELNQENT